MSDPDPLPASPSSPPPWTPPAPPTPSLRWAVRLPPGSPSPRQLTLASAALPDPAARAAVGSFHRPADRTRALASRLLQAAAPAGAGLPGIGWGSAPIARTAKGGKPYLDFNDAGAWEGGCDAAPLRAWREASAPNFNFNVSHDGAWAALAAEPVALVGVDIAAPPSARGGGGSSASLRGVAELKRDFEACLAPSEWAAVEAAGASAASDATAAEDAAFRAHWALKEAFAKARGDGLGCDFGGLAFEGVVGGGRGEVLVRILPQAPYLARVIVVVVVVVAVVILGRSRRGRY